MNERIMRARLFRLDRELEKVGYCTFGVVRRPVGRVTLQVEPFNFYKPPVGVDTGAIVRKFFPSAVLLPPDPLLIPCIQEYMANFVPTVEELATVEDRDEVRQQMWYSESERSRNRRRSPFGPEVTF